MSPLTVPRYIWTNPFFGSTAEKAKAIQIQDQRLGGVQPMERVRGEDGTFNRTSIIRLTEKF